MTEAEEFNKESAEQWGTDAFDDEIEFVHEPQEFEAWLHKSTSLRNKKRTARSIYSTAESVQRVFASTGGIISERIMKDHVRGLQDSDVAPSTINSYICAMRVYAKFLAERYGKNIFFHINTLQTQPKQYIDNVISRADYDFMVNEARKDTKHPNVYLGIRIMGTTGVRRMELLQVKVEHIKLGYIDVVGKGAKRRRIYFPKGAREESREYLSQLGVDSGYVIRRWRTNGTKDGDQNAFLGNTRSDDIKEIRAFERTFNQQIMRFGQALGLDESVLHPHGFRHFFAKEFLKHRLDIALLADLLGHSSLEVTRIYLKMTSREQADVIDETVTW